MDNTYKNIEEYNPNKKHKMLIVFDDVIADMLCTKNLNPIVTELFIKGRQLNISESYFAIPKNIKLLNYCFKYWMKSDKPYILCIEKKKLLKKYIII